MNHLCCPSMTIRRIDSNRKITGSFSVLLHINIGVTRRRNIYIIYNELVLPEVHYGRNSRISD